MSSHDDCLSGGGDHSTLCNVNLLIKYLLIKIKEEFFTGNSFQLGNLMRSLSKHHLVAFM